MIEVLDCELSQINIGEIVEYVEALTFHATAGYLDASLIITRSKNVGL
jgi:hypothetical protein